MRRWLGLCGVLLIAPAAQASPAEQFGFGPRSQAMSGAGPAVARGFSATYENPALLARMHHRELTLGFQAVRFSLRAQGPNAPGRLSEEGVSGSFIGAVLPLPFGGILEDRLTLGLGTFTPNDLIARARLLYPERLQFPLLTDRAQTLNFNMGLGVDLGHGIQIGGGALALAELVGTVVVRTDSSGRVGTTVDDQLIATYAPIVGVAVDLGTTDLGLTWRGALEGDFDVVVQVYDLGSLTVPDLNISGVAQYDPMQLQAEVAQEVGDFTVVGGATWSHWSAFEGWRKATVECPPTQPDCAALKAQPVSFHDIVVPRIGGMYGWSLSDSAHAELRAGYAFAKSPLGPQTGPSNYFDNDRHVLSVGYGVELAEPLPPITVDAFYQLHLLAPRTHEKRADVPADNLGAPQVKSSGTVQNAGVFLGVKF
ncbi:MAG: outer membrane protein transport protein [Myxococcales bacterium]|nr:outer membrane protein transport protein [Myxococcales bacterium]MCB9580575.1 outer membrane protein transport protein [Polyangiaceae bacterium]